jgi:hypothetical protein
MKFLKKILLLVKIICIFTINLHSISLSANNFSNEIKIIEERKVTKIDKVNFYSDKGINILNSSSYKNDFFQLINFFQPQLNPLYCGIASSVIIINALKYGSIPNQPSLAITKPAIIGGGTIEFHLYTQETFLNEITDNIKNRSIIEFRKPSNIKDEKSFDPGITLDQLAKILEKAYGLNVAKYHSEKYSTDNINDFRRIIKEIVTDDNKFLIVNFDGKILSNKTNGHISPLIAYNEKEDMALIMDVALYKNQWQWHKIDNIYKAMNSKDGDQYRGFLIVSNK